jgi:hypothetical protein
MFTVVRNDVLELAASVPARRAAGIRAGQVVRFTADGRRFEGRVARVSPDDRPGVALAHGVRRGARTRTGALRGNSFATGRVVGRSVPDALLVPTTAIRQGTDSTATFVYRVAGERLERAPVRLGIVDDVQGVAEVAEGLKAGDRVVVGQRRHARRGDAGDGGGRGFGARRRRDDPVSRPSAQRLRQHPPRGAAPRSSSGFGTQCFSPTSRSSARCSRP